MAMLKSPDIRIQKGRLRKQHGLALYARDEQDTVIGMRVTIDPRNAPVVTIMVHELLHLYLAINYRIDIDFTDPLEEAMVSGLADELTCYLHKSENDFLFKKWVKAIEQRLS